MAKEDKKTEDAEDDLDLGDEKAPGKKKLIILIAGVFLLINIGIGAYFFLFMSDIESVDGETVEGEEAVEEVVEEDADDDRPTFYHGIPDLVVSLEGNPSMLQVGLQVRVRGEAMASFLSHNDPMIRHEFLSILSTQDGKKLKKRTNKEALQKLLIGRLRQIVVESDGPEPEKGIEAIYFVSFVTQ